MKKNLIKYRSRFFAASLILAVFFLSGCGTNTKLVKVSVDQPVSTATTAVKSATPIKTTTGQQAPAQPIKTSTTQQEVLVPNSFALKVAFASQAPLSNWDALHEETCEEASMVMAEKYFKNLPLTPQIMEDELQKLVSWEGDNGYSVDLTAAQATKIMNEEMGLNASVVSEVTADRIKYELYKGNLIIIPVAGRLLGNPNFTGAGPIYHMLLIKGYTDSLFITNDPGTRKGNGYEYSYATILNAIHDWNQKLIGPDGKMSDINMAKGAKVMIIIARN